MLRCRRNFPIVVVKRDLTALSVTRLAPQTKSNVDNGRVCTLPATTMSVELAVNATIHSDIRKLTLPALECVVDAIISALSCHLPTCWTTSR